MRKPRSQEAIDNVQQAAEELIATLDTSQKETSFLIEAMRSFHRSMQGDCWIPYQGNWLLIRRSPQYGENSYDGLDFFLLEERVPPPRSFGKVAMEHFYVSFQGDEVVEVVKVNVEAMRARNWGGGYHPSFLQTLDLENLAVQRELRQVFPKYLQISR